MVLDRGRALVLLDGLDEVTKEDGKNITKEIKRFARAYPQVQVIVTCRTQSQESRFERFDYVEVADFNEPQVRVFAQHWFKTVMGDESAGLARAQEFLGLLLLEENKSIRELTITPILLSLTCTVFHQTGKFYSKHSKLYEEGLELLLEQWDKSRSIERDEIYRDLSVERKMELLSYLAVKKFEQEQYVLFEQAEVEGYIAEFLGIGQRDSRVVLRAIELQHGLLIERSQKVWSFSHLTFQEYLVARVIIASSNLETLLQHLTDAHWREVFLLASAMLKPADNLLKLMKYKTDDLLSYDSELQKLLAWVSQKADSVAVPYHSAAVRSFYLTLLNQYNFDNTSFKSLMSNKLVNRVSQEEFKQYNIKTQLLGVGKRGKSILILSLLSSSVFDKELSGTIENNFFIDFNKPRNFLECDIYNASELASELFPELSEELIKLSRQLPQPATNRMKFREWWQIYGQSWNDRLKFILKKYQKTACKWKLNRKQKELLQRYYNANKLLIDCLYISCNVSFILRREIEKTLFLPHTEVKIEKCKRNR